MEDHTSDQSTVMRLHNSDNSYYRWCTMWTRMTKEAATIPFIYEKTAHREGMNVAFTAEK